MRNLLAHLEQYQATLADCRDISAEGARKLDDMANKLRAATIVEVNRVARPEQLDERARQAAAQGAGDRLLGGRD